MRLTSLIARRSWPEKGNAQSTLILYTLVSLGVVLFLLDTRTAWLRTALPFPLATLALFAGAYRFPTLAGWLASFVAPLVYTGWFGLDAARMTAYLFIMEATDPRSRMNLLEVAASLLIGALPLFALSIVIVFRLWRGRPIPPLDTDGPPALS